MSFRRLLALLAAAALPVLAEPPSNTYSIAGPAPRSALPAQLRAAPGSIPTARVRLPAPSPLALEKVREANDVPGPKRIQVGVGRPLQAQPEAKPERFQWQRLAEGWVGHWEVTSEGAASLRVALRLQGLPDAAEVRFTDIAEAIVHGPFAAAEVQAQSPYWSPVIEGATVRVEVFLPAHSAPGQVRVELDSVSHLYVSPTGRFDPLFGSGHSGTCTQDLICATGTDAALALAGKSVAGMTFSDAGGTYACTGTLLNPKGTQLPYFYSAAHCIDTQAMASTLTTHWSFDRTACGTGGTTSGYVQVAGGAQLLFANADSDVLLLKLNNSPPAGAVYSAWDSATLATGTALVGIHHPGGDWKKLSRGASEGFFEDLPSGYPQGSFTVLGWTRGVTEAGSSGSGIFSFDGSAYKLRGGLWGGASSCQNPGFEDYYSRFDQVFPSLAQWLDPPTNPPATPCTYALSRNSISVSAGANTDTITVTPSASSCTWRASSGASWVALSDAGTGASAHAGQGTFRYTIAANNSTAGRNGTLTVAGTTVPVEQSAAPLPPPDPTCTYALSPAVRTTDSAATTGTVVVDTTASCAWTPISDVPWLQTTPSGGGFTYVVQANTSTSARTATVTVGNKTFTLYQAEPGGFPPTPPGTPALGVSASSHDFGGQSMGTTSALREIVITNTGGGVLDVTSIARSNAQFGATTNCISLFAGESCSVYASFTPSAAAGALNSTVQVAGTLAITSNAAGSPHSVALTGTAEKSLVTHYYRSILRRAPDSGGVPFWQGEAARVAGLGANVNETWFALAQAFFSSAEYLAFNRDPTGFVTDLYATFFNRAPDAAGLNYWVSQASQGLPREVVLVSFMFSAEFNAFTQGIFGNTAARAEVDTVIDFYRGLLSRLPDSAGFDYWVGEFRTAQCQGAGAVFARVESISNAYVNSPEYAARGRSNAQFVGDMYNAFLRRGGDLPGVQFWIGQLDSGGMTRDQVRRAFITTPEFNARVQAVIAQGCAG